MKRGFNEPTEIMLEDLIHDFTHSPDPVKLKSIGQIFRGMADKREASANSRSRVLTTRKYKAIQRNLNRALDAYHIAFSQDPLDIETAFAIVEIALKMKLNAMAFDYARAALSIDGNSQKAWELLGKVHEAVLEPDRARTCAFNAQMAKEGRFDAIKQDAARNKTAQITQNLDTL